MCDCRLCKNHYTIFRSELDENVPDKKVIICMKKEVFIEWEYVPNGDCEYYVDMDSNYPED